MPCGSGTERLDLTQERTETRHNHINGRRVADRGVIIEEGDVVVDRVDEPVLGEVLLERGGT